MRISPQKFRCSARFGVLCAPSSSTFFRCRISVPSLENRIPGILHHHAEVSKPLLHPFRPLSRPNQRNLPLCKISWFPPLRIKLVQRGCARLEGFLGTQRRVISKPSSIGFHLRNRIRPPPLWDGSRLAENCSRWSNFLTLLSSGFASESGK